MDSEKPLQVLLKCPWPPRWARHHLLEVEATHLCQWLPSSVSSPSVSASGTQHGARARIPQSTDNYRKLLSPTFLNTCEPPNMLLAPTVNKTILSEKVVNKEELLSLTSLSLCESVLLRKCVERMQCSRPVSPQSCPKAEIGPKWPRLIELGDKKGD